MLSQKLYLTWEGRLGAACWGKGLSALGSRRGTGARGCGLSEIDSKVRNQIDLPLRLRLKQGPRGQDFFNYRVSQNETFFS